MFEAATHPAPALGHTIGSPQPIHDFGATAPQDTTSIVELLSAALDEIDYGVIVTNAQSIVLANHAARAALAGQHPLRLSGMQLLARAATDAAALWTAISSAVTRGHRHMLTLGCEPDQAAVAVLPLPGYGGRSAALVLLGRHRACQRLSIDAFARSHGLTCAETTVLAQLCDGRRPSEVAVAQGVTMSTIRTQIGSVRAKTGTKSIGTLLRQVSTLPPILPALRSASYQ